MFARRERRVQRGEDCAQKGRFRPELGRSPDGAPHHYVLPILDKYRVDAPSSCSLRWLVGVF